MTTSHVILSLVLWTIVAFPFAVMVGTTIRKMDGR